MRAALILILILSFDVSVRAQNQITALDLEIQRAQRAFDARKYNTAAAQFKRIYPKVKVEDKQNEILFMVAESYRRANNFKQAFEWYEKLVNTKYPNPKILYSYGLLLKNFERYEEASRAFYDYLFEMPGDSNAIREIQSCSIVQQWKAKPQKFDIKNVGELNTQVADYAPYYAGGKLFWASSRPEATGNEIFEWTGQKCSDFFEATLSNGVWSKVQNVKGAVNTNFNEGVACIDSTLSTIYFTQCNGIDGKGMNCKIYVSYFQNNAWGEPKMLPFCSDSFSVGHPAISADGKQLFFASDMQGGFGEKDIYAVSYDMVRDKWGTPQNLGPNVNSAEDDMFPFVDETGKLYYASKGFTGMGGLDLFVTFDSAGAYVKARNLLHPINSGGDDFGITFLPSSQVKENGAIGYYSSNREGGKGDDDIYSISIKPYIFVLKGKVFDRESMEPLAQAVVAVKDAYGNPIFSIKTGPSGEYTGELPLNAIHNLAAVKDKYFASSSVIISTQNIKQDSVLEINLILEPIPAEDVDFTLKGIFYDLDKWDLREESRKVLDSLTTILYNNPTLVIELASHTDSRAPQDYNLELSKKRAKSCVDYLITKGIAKERLISVGYGETKLVNDCADGVECSDEEHQQNRRTTFRVLRSDYKGKR
jgi:outer membrane protein OmpA-like peptidoglycan-associated protein